MSTLTPEIHVGSNNPDEPLLPLATDGVLRYVWHGKFSDMLVEVLGNGVFVDGQRVEPLLPDRPAVAPTASHQQLFQKPARLIAWRSRRREI